MPDGITIVKGLPRGARAFVFTSFASGYSPHAGSESAEGFKVACIDPLERLIALGFVGVHVAHLAGVPDELVGWSAVMGDALVYVYVKQLFRKRGIASALVPDGLERVVFRTPNGEKFERARFGHLLQPAPYLLAERAAA